MDVDEIAFLNVMARKLKECYHQRNVYRLVLAHLKASGVPEVDEIIEVFLQDETLQELSDNDFAFLDKRLSSIFESELDAALREWLTNMPPSPFSN